jgi:hypothetical protein
MESLDRSRAVIELGKRLVVQLKLGDDLLSQWMAHLIAERMDAVEHALPEARTSAQDACAATVFQLWDHRNSLPAHIRPFRALEPLLETLASLNVESGRRFRYFPMPPDQQELDAASDSSKRALALAMNLDGAARILIQHFLAEASEGAADAVRPWLEAAIDAQADVALELRVVEFVSAGISNPSDDEVARKALEDKVKKLQVFADLANAIASDLQGRLTQPAGGEGSAPTNDREPNR